ncbi:MAG: M28 family peptidase [Bacteroidetes bacterium]|nr:M28 family peptidase [Bacteroidota bacterium]
MKNRYIILTIGIVFLISCKQPKIKVDDTQQQKTVKKVDIPAFNADSAYYFTEKQVSFGPRVPNTKMHESCANYLISTLKRYCKDVTVQDFQSKAWNGTLLKSKNIIVSFNPETNNRIFFASHWDSRPCADYDPDEKNHNKAILGANDGAAGVGMLMEIARLLSQRPCKTGVDLILFDVEDYGEPRGTANQTEESWCLGSQYWAKNPHKQGYFAKFGILLDMAGAKNAVFAMENTSMYYAPDIMKKVWDVAASLGYSNYFITDKTGGLIDDHMYINKYAKIPCIDIVHYDASTTSHFFPYWHTVKDDMSNIDKTTLTVVGNTLLTVAYGEE